MINIYVEEYISSAYPVLDGKEEPIGMHCYTAEVADPVGYFKEKMSDECAVIMTHLID